MFFHNAITSFRHCVTSNINLIDTMREGIHDIDNYVLLSAGDLTTCPRNYKKVGCFTDKSDQSKSMLVYDRYGIQWKNIEAYLHR